jgi:hypothetical protein
LTSTIILAGWKTEVVVSIILSAVQILLAVGSAAFAYFCKKKQKVLPSLIDTSKSAELDTGAVATTLNMLDELSETQINGEKQFVPSSTMDQEVLLYSPEVQQKNFQASISAGEDGFYASTATTVNTANPNTYN